MALCANEKTNIINNLSAYMFTAKNVKQIQNTQLSFSTNIQPIKRTIIPKHEYYVPDKKDTLFWCFYIIHFGFDKYNLVGNTYFSMEKNFKIEMVEPMRKSKPMLKMHKLKIHDVEDELVNCQKIGIMGFSALCLYHNINYIIINGRTYTELILNDDDKVFVLHKIGDIYSYDIDASNEKIEQYRNTYYHIVDINKPIKGISAYKVDELNEIAKKLNIDLNKSYNKKELYQEILNKF
jgi:hypothetical protein